MVQARCAWSVKTRRVPSRHGRDTRVYDHTTTAMNDMSPTPPLPSCPLDHPAEGFTGPRTSFWWRCSIIARLVVRAFVRGIPAPPAPSRELPKRRHIYFSQNPSVYPMCFVLLSLRRSLDVPTTNTSGVGQVVQCTRGRLYCMLYVIFITRLVTMTS